jgi:hypothetical protein
VGQFDELTQLVDEVNNRFRMLTYGTDLLPATSLVLQSEDIPEAGFLRLVSWLWSLYQETGKLTLEALTGVSNVMSSDRVGDHLRDSSLLRTFMQHHLDETTVDDRRKAELARGWLDAHSAGRRAEDPEYWLILVAALGDQAKAFLSEITGAIDGMASTEFGPEFRALLRARLERTIPAYEVDDMIEALKPLYGLEHLDTRAFRDRNYQTWRDQTRLIASDRNPGNYMRDLIEQALSRHVEAEPAPLSGDEMMDIFGLAPGPDIGRLKRRAEELAASGLRSKRALVEALAAEFSLTTLGPLENL